MSADSGTYYVVVYAKSGAGAYALNVHEIPAVKFKVSGVSAPKSAKKGKPVQVSAIATPVYNGLFSPVKFEFYRWESHKWKRKGTKWATTGKDVYPVKSTLFVSYKFPTKGSWRVRAGLQDEAHTKTIYGAYKKITIK
jgi:hypothetical protein